MDNENQSFSYTYSAKQQNEIKLIRDKYLPREENKMDQLRMMDKSVTRKAMVYSITIGVIYSEA